jgi:uncharacterized protein YprB with RNaseH-like and TPR domain
MIAPVKQLKKSEIEWLNEHRCRHSHTYLEHYNCFIEEKPEDCPFSEEVGFFDIEASNFNADFGYLLSYAIKRKDGEIYGRALTGKEIRNYVFDKELVQECCEDLKRFHRIIVYYGTDYRFDIPFLRTRAIKYGHEFPLYKDIYVQDAYSLVKAKLKLHRNRLESVCIEFDIPAKEHKLIPDIWQKAMAGHDESLQYIWLHNKEDVISLEKLWVKLESYTLKSKRSI